MLGVGDDDGEDIVEEGDGKRCGYCDGGIGLGMSPEVLVKG